MYLHICDRCGKQVDRFVSNNVPKYTLHNGIDICVTEDVVQLLTDKDALIRQSALWALDGLIVDTKKRRQYFLKMTHDKDVSVAQLANKLLKEKK